MSTRIGIVLLAAFALGLAVTTVVFVAAPATATAGAPPVAPLALAASSPPVAAQQWSPEEQELLGVMEVCWDAWMDAVRAEDVEIWVNGCNIAEDYSMWWTNESTPQGLRMTRRAFQLWDDLDLDWLDFRPVAIRIWGDTAMLQFYGYWLVQNGEERSVTEYMRTEVFRRVDGQWQFLGGQGTPVTAPDADPFQ